ncbi:phosphohydrolase [Marinobacterium iners]|uniref:HD domain-containing protein n=1 Tax=Marinobacterium iners TaxID=48076 RepID=UPI001AF1B799|nr:HD domain-containing protein [Marinobacterium iners]QSR33992.1 phosphohydrolase [Marinobacterium iners]
MNISNTLADHTQPYHDLLRITSLVTHTDQDGEPVHELKLSCWSMTYTAFANSQCWIEADALGHLSLVEVMGHCVWEDQIPVLYLTYIGKPKLDQFMSLPCLYTLPRDLCPLPDISDQLVHAVVGLKTKPLQHFVKLVLERRDRLQAFMQLPASQNDHHAYPGGLLEHSLSVARNVIGMIQLNEPEMPIEMQEAGFIAGLLHDIGKTRTYRKGGFQQPMALLMDHDQLTLELCAVGLSYLDRAIPEIATMLRHVWTCASPGARYGKPAMTTLARYLRDADGQSAMSNTHKRVSRNYSKRGMLSSKHQRLWLPATNQPVYTSA